MNHIIKNDLDVFSFHDAELRLKNYDQKTLVVNVSHLNISKESKENPFEYDIEIKSAVMTFDEIEINYLEPMVGYKIDENGNYYTDKEKVIYKSEEARNRLLDALKKGVDINCIDVTHKSVRTAIEMSTCGNEMFFVGFSFADVTVEWDEYLKKAWYELHRQYKHNIILETPTGKLETIMYIITHEEDVYYNGELEKAPSVNVGIKYKEKAIWGHGTDYCFADAFADLQKQLDDGVTLRCCITCRHGNFCPYGNEQGKIFCTKDKAINSKEDMCKQFDNMSSDNLEELTRHVTDTCENYEPQTKDYYTYNDYLHYLSK